MKLFKEKIRGGYLKSYFCGICYKKTKGPFYNVYAQFEKNYKEKNFDVRYLDKEIVVKSNKVYDESFKQFIQFKHKYAFFATELYKTGGHTPCLVNLASSLFEGHKVPLFLSRLTNCQTNAPSIMADLEKVCTVYGINYYEISTLYNKIIDDAPEVAFIYIHPNDVIFASVLYLLKKHTPITLIYFNHASHFPNLGMSFVDVILEGMPTTEKITKEKRKLAIPTKIVGLQSLGKNETLYRTKEEINSIKQDLGIKKDEFVTVSGGSSYKFFDVEGSQYFEMIRELLGEEKNLKHVIITNLSDKQKGIVDAIFNNDKEAYSRLIIHPLTPDFESLFQCADVFIDSFPVASALTQIDLMRLKVASVVKVNKDVPELSFHEYHMQGYPYMFEKIEDMKNGILELLHDEEKKKEIVAKNYTFWLETYEKEVVKKKYLAIVNEVKNA